jgi:uncharacterized protein YdbL (DUF1318 family)
MNDIQRFERLYGAAGRELRRRLLSLDPTTYTDAEAEEVRRETETLVRTLNFAVSRWANEAIPRAYAKGARIARTALEILGKKPRKPQLIDKRRILIDDLLILLVRANNSIGGTVDRYLGIVRQSATTQAVASAQLQEFDFQSIADKVNRLTASAIKQEQTRGWLTKTIREYLSKVVKAGDFLNINGKNFNMEKYAKLVARTELRKANTEATIETARQFENDLVAVSDHGTVCDECKEYEGNVYSLTGWNTKYPMLPAQPPFHPNCQHYLLCTSEEAIEVRKEYGETDWARQMRELKQNKESMYEYAQRTFSEQGPFKSRGI